MKIIIFGSLSYFSIGYLVPIYQEVTILFSFKFDSLDGNVLVRKCFMRMRYFNFAHKLNSQLWMEYIYIYIYVIILARKVPYTACVIINIPHNFIFQPD